MKIAILGYGKMGKVIESIAVKRGHEIVLKSTSQKPFSSADLKDKNVNVVIEFTRPEAAVKNLFKCLEAKVPVVTGTTGWYNRLPEVRTEFENAGGSLFYASNFSIGVNIFFEMNKNLARIMDMEEQYKVNIHEIHHTEKLDAPSGTAITLAEGIVDNMKRKNGWTDQGNENEGLIHVSSDRKPGVPGTHIITYESDDDIIRFEHMAKGRNGFAMGAVKAAEWLVERRGVYTMKDMLKFN